MIELKVDEEKPTDSLEIELTEEQKKAFEAVIARKNKLLLKAEPSNVSIIDADISKELHELNKTLKDILREMRKRKV